jgi:hypothetical protein
MLPPERGCGRPTAIAAPPPSRAVADDLMHRLDWVSLPNLRRGDSRRNNAARSPGSSDLPKPARRSIRPSIEGSDQDGPEGQGSRYRRREWRDRSGVRPALGSSGRKNRCWLQQQIRAGTGYRSGTTRIGPPSSADPDAGNALDPYRGCDGRAAVWALRRARELRRVYTGDTAPGATSPMAAQKPLWTPWRCRWRGSWGPKSR